MCGRYVLKATLQHLSETYGVAPKGTYSSAEPSYNVAPSAHMPVILEDGGQRLIRPHRWGPDSLLGRQREDRILHDQRAG